MISKLPPSDQRTVMSCPISLAVLIDDDDIDNKAHQRVMKKSGLVAETKVFTYAGDALEFLRATDQPVDLILLDINMPRMNGFEFLSQYGNDHKPEHQASVLMMLSTSSSPVDVKRADGFAEVCEYIEKPLTLQHFEHFVARYFSELPSGQD